MQFDNYSTNNDLLTDLWDVKQPSSYHQPHHGGNTLPGLHDNNHLNSISYQSLNSLPGSTTYGNYNDIWSNNLSKISSNNSISSDAAKNYFHSHGESNGNMNYNYSYNYPLTMNSGSSSPAFAHTTHINPSTTNNSPITINNSHGFINNSMSNSPNYSPSSLNATNLSHLNSFNGNIPSINLNVDASSNSSDDKKPVNTQLYKTELCGSFMKLNYCPYGNKCQFAHGDNELKIIKRPNNYRSKDCINWKKFGTCRYGNRCCFKHD